tara:strand:- start:9536 stop:10618 length:1083 start_codon:yes stop_codon:yes gene_type:complete
MSVRKNKKKIIILFTILSNHSFSLFEKIKINSNRTLEIFTWSNNDKFSFGNYFNYPENELIIHKLSLRNYIYNFKKILITLFNKDVEVIFIPGWQYFAYIFCIVLVRILKRNVKVISGFDDIYFPNKIKHKYLLPLFGKFFRLIAPFAWVSGHYSNLFAKKMGYKDPEIIPNALSASNDYEYVDAHSNTFIFIGREDYIKGLDILIKAWKVFRKEFRHWKLEIVGTNAYNDKKLNIYSHGYKDQKFISRLFSNGGFGIVPSRRDQWCVVVHEFLSSGIPAIVSSSVGCIPDFFDNDYPLKFAQDYSHENLLEKMRFAATMNKDEIFLLKKSCFKSSKSINSTKSANLFVSYFFNENQNGK